MGRPPWSYLHLSLGRPWTRSLQSRLKKRKYIFSDRHKYLKKQKQDIYLKKVTKDLEPCSIELSKTDCFEENAYIDILWLTLQGKLGQFMIHSSCNHFDWSLYFSFWKWYTLYHYKSLICSIYCIFVMEYFCFVLMQLSQPVFLYFSYFCKNTPFTFFKVHVAQCHVTKELQSCKKLFREKAPWHLILFCTQLYCIYLHWNWTAYTYTAILLHLLAL